MVYSMVFHERALHNYFIPFHIKYSGKHNQCNRHVTHDGKFECNTVEYNTAPPYSDWLYFPWYGIKGFTLILSVVVRLSYFSGLMSLLLTVIPDLTL